MNNRLKRAIALFIILNMLLSLLPAAAALQTGMEPPEPPAAQRNGAPGVTAGALNPFTATVKWNDNFDQGSKRPDVTAALSHYSLAFSYDYNGTTVSGSVTADHAQLGLSTAPVPTLEPLGGASIGSWAYTVAGLPGQVTVTDTAAQPVTCSVTYTLEQTPFVGYLPITPSTASNGETITNTVTQAWTANIRWCDDQGYYGTRPGNDDVIRETKIYRYVPGQTPTAPLTPGDGVTLGIGALQTDAEDRHYYAVTLENAPAYDADGTPYVYYITPYDQTQDAGAGEYKPQYVNEGNHSTQTVNLYEGGTAAITLTNTTSFAVTKKWIDGGNASRPVGVTLHLYRIPVKMAGGSPVVDISTLRPVQGHDSISVPVTDDSIAYPPNVLPMYDAHGCKYVYFAKETGLSAGDYHFIIENPLTGVEAIDEAFADETTTYLKLDDFEETTPTYILNGGTITNKLVAATQIPVTKAFNAQAMQNMEAAGAAMQLQWRPAGGDWQDVPNDAVFRGSPVVTVTGFSSDQMEQTALGPVVNKYNTSGERVAYRWVEKSVTIGSETVELAGGSWIPDASGTAYTYEHAGSEVLVRIPGKAPGVDGTPTTAYFRPTMTAAGDGSFTVTNTLVGKTQVAVEKVWDGTAPPPGTTVTLKLRRVEGNLQSSNNLTDANGTNVDDIVLNGSEAEPWTALWSNLERYDANGKEYTYEVTEAAVNSPGIDTWASDFSYIRSVERVGTDDITQLKAVITNSTGTGPALKIIAQKQWLDGGDLLTRKPVTVGLYRVKDADGNELSTPEQVGTAAVLTASKNWRHEFSVAKAGDDKAEYYMVKELSAAGVDVDYSIIDSELFTKATDTAFDINYPYEKKFGTLGADDSTGKLDYVYHVFIQRKSINAENTHAVWEISNQRTGVMTIVLNKTWRAGGDAPAAKFQLSRTGKGTGATETMIEEITLGDGSTIPITSQGTGGVKLAEYTFTNETDGGLRKYDNKGEQYSYPLKEISVGGTAIAADGSVTLNGDRYVTSLELTGTLIKGGGANHHTGDVYTYSAGNDKADTYTLTAHKLWRDNGTTSSETARPDIYFNLYRVTDDYVHNSKTLEQWANYKNATALAAGLKAALDANSVTLCASQKLWNTTHNDWYWSCDLGSVPRYDASGNRYIYFLLEQTSGNAGNYQSPVYYNAQPIPAEPEKWRPGTPANPSSSRDVFSVPLADMGSDKVLILSDGQNCQTPRRLRQLLFLHGNELPAGGSYHYVSQDMADAAGLALPDRPHA